MIKTMLTPTSRPASMTRRTVVNRSLFVEWVRQRRVPFEERLEVDDDNGAAFAHLYIPQWKTRPGATLQKVTLPITVFIGGKRDCGYLQGGCEELIATFLFQLRIWRASAAVRLIAQNVDDLEAFSTSAALLGASLPFSKVEIVLKFAVVYGLVEYVTECANSRRGRLSPFCDLALDARAELFRFIRHRFKPELK